MRMRQCPVCGVLIVVFASLAVTGHSHDFVMPDHGLHVDEYRPPAQPGTYGFYAATLGYLGSVISGWRPPEPDGHT